MRIVAIVQLDDFGDSSEPGDRNLTALEAMNAMTWARRQFANWYLSSSGDEPPVEPFDGLDKMLILSWACRKFTNDQPFVLHYWDLHMNNILIDEENNLKAYFKYQSYTLMKIVSSIGKAFLLFRSKYLQYRSQRLSRVNLHTAD